MDEAAAIADNIGYPVVVRPSYVLGGRAMEIAHNREQLLRSTRDRTPAGRLLEPQDVANVVVFLCTDDASMIHGQTLVVDGGYSIVA